MKTLTLFTLLAFALHISPLTAVIHQVRTGDNLQAKIDGAADGDTVYIKEGTHAGDLVINGKHSPYGE